MDLASAPAFEGVIPRAPPPERNAGWAAAAGFASFPDTRKTGFGRADLTPPQPYFRFRSQCPRQSLYNVYGDVALATFDQPYVGAVQAGSVRQGFLG